MASGYRAEPAGINSEGMRRNGFSPEQIANVKNAYKILYRQGLSYEETRHRIGKLAETAPELLVLHDFFTNSQRSIIR